MSTGPYAAEPLTLEDFHFDPTKQDFDSTKQDPFTLEKLPNNPSGIKEQNVKLIVEFQENEKPKQADDTHKHSMMDLSKTRGFPVQPVENPTTGDKWDKVRQNLGPIRRQGGTCPVISLDRKNRTPPKTVNTIAAPVAAAAPTVTAEPCCPLSRSEQERIARLPEDGNWIDLHKAKSELSPVQKAVQDGGACQIEIKEDQTMARQVSDGPEITLEPNQEKNLKAPSRLEQTTPGAYIHGVVKIPKGFVKGILTLFYVSMAINGTACPLPIIQRCYDEDQIDFKMAADAWKVDLEVKNGEVVYDGDFVASVKNGSFKLGTKGPKGPKGKDKNGRFSLGIPTEKGQKDVSENMAGAGGFPFKLFGTGNGNMETQMDQIMRNIRNGQHVKAKLCGIFQETGAGKRQFFVASDTFIELSMPGKIKKRKKETGSKNCPAAQHDQTPPIKKRKLSEDQLISALCKGTAKFFMHGIEIAYTMLKDSDGGWAIKFKNGNVVNENDVQAFIAGEMRGFIIVALEAGLGLDFGDIVIEMRE